MWLSGADPPAPPAEHTDLGLPTWYLAELDTHTDLRSPSQSPRSVCGTLALFIARRFCLPCPRGGSWRQYRAPLVCCRATNAFHARGPFQELSDRSAEDNRWYKRAPIRQNLALTVGLKPPHHFAIEQTFRLLDTRLPSPAAVQGPLENKREEIGVMLGGSEQGQKRQIGSLLSQLSERVSGSLVTPRRSISLPRNS